MAHIYANIREVLTDLVGASIVDVTQNDPPEPPFVDILLSNGYSLRFPITELGFQLHPPHSDKGPTPG